MAINECLENCNSYESSSNPLITPLVYDCFHMISKIKELPVVQSVYMSTPTDKTDLQFYVFMEKEDLDVEDIIHNYFVDWQTDYKYFPEMHILPLDQIEAKESYLTKNSIKL